LESKDIRGLKSGGSPVERQVSHDSDSLRSI